MTEGSQAAYLQVADDLRRRMDEGELPPGARLPSRSELSKAYGFTEAICRQAVRLLVAEGLLVAQQGDATYVRIPELHKQLHRIPGEPDNDLPFRAESATDIASEDIAGRLGIKPGEPVMRTEYVYLDGRRGVRIVHSWEPMEITGRHTVVLPEAGPHSRLGVAKRMALIDVAVARVREVVRARNATFEEARRLEIPQAATVMAIQRTHLDKTGRAVETGDIVVPADRWEVVYDTEVPR